MYLTRKILRKPNTDQSNSHTWAQDLRNSETLCIGERNDDQHPHGTLQSLQLPTLVAIMWEC